MNKKILKYMAAAITLAVFASCNDIVDYNDGYTPLEEQANAGAPVITAVYEVGDTLLERPITEAQAGQMVRIVGRNLNRPTRITFNTVEADLAEVYTYSTSANVMIPQELSMEHRNQIEYTTAEGTATFDFTVPFPQLSVDGLECEFTDAGDSVVITGRNFDYYDFGTTSQVTLGGTALGLGSITNTSMKALVPAGTPDNSTIQISWNDGSTGEAMTATLPFRPTQHLLYGDFSDVQFAIDGPITMNVEADGSAGEDVSALGNPHMHITGTFDAWAWNTIDLSRDMIDAGSLDNLDDYVLKFEVLTANDYPLTEASPLQFSFNWGESYTWTPGDGLGLNTHGQWQTVTLPLAPMATAGISAPGTWQSLRIAFQPTAAYTADFRIGNLRIEHR